MGMALEKPSLSLDAYLAWEAEQPGRNEFVDGEIYAMVGVRDSHNTIALNVAMALKMHLKGTPCRVFAMEVKLLVASEDSVFYPDVFVTCASAGDPLVKRDAKLIVEVLSPSTEAYDRGRKFSVYRQLPDLQEYLLINGDQAKIELFRRTGPEQWLIQEFGPGQGVHLTSVDLDLTVAEVYDEVVFETIASTTPQGQ